MLLLRRLPAACPTSSCRAAGRARSASSAAVAAAQATIERTGRLFIDNACVDAEGGAQLEVVSPADGRPFARLAHASAADVDRAVASARACFDGGGWSDAGAAARAQVLRRAAAALRDRAEELSWIESRDCGKPLSESQGDIGFCADAIDYYAEVAPSQLEARPLELPAALGGGDFSARVEQEPLGVVGCITPWNYPLQQAVLKVAPALAAGCTVVLKPSPLASLTCCAFGEIVAAAGAPPGALNVVTGGPPEALADGGSTGQTLIDHPKLDKVSFTGSCAAGRSMLESSARRLRPTALELGGKSAFIVFDDSEEYLDAVVDWAMVGIFSNTGQVCSATSRLLVQKGIEAELTSRLVRAAAKIRVGDPLAEGTQMGPAVSRGQQEKILAALSRARDAGCTVHAAELAIPEALQGGFYVPPALVTEVPTDSSAWRDEIFGPVLAIRSFSTEDEAVELANATHFGLANAVYSADAERCARVARKLQSGVVWENCSQVLFPNTPFGGRVGKTSGFGWELGVVGLMEYVSGKTVVSASKPGFSWGAYS